jgi:simple sugar transport system permease protein
MLTGITFAVGAKAGLFNIGAEGQVYIGAIAAIAISQIAMPRSIGFIVTIAFCMLAGALWGFPAALLKATRGVHEVVSTIMLNWIANFLCLYLIAGPLVDLSRPQQTVRIPEPLRFPVIVQGSQLTAAIFVCIAFVFVVYFVLWYLPVGYELRAVGLNPDASRFGGISQSRTIIRSFTLGGFASGLAGGLSMMGMPPTYALHGTLGNVINLGFDGIGVALIGRNHPIGIIFSSIFFAGLYTGARGMQIYAGVPVEIVRGIEGIIIIAAAMPEILTMISGRVKKWR